MARRWWVLCATTSWSRQNPPRTVGPVSCIAMSATSCRRPGEPRSHRRMPAGQEPSSNLHLSPLSAAIETHGLDPALRTSHRRSPQAPTQGSRKRRCRTNRSSPFHRPARKTTAPTVAPSLIVNPSAPTRLSPAAQPHLRVRLSRAMKPSGTASSCLIALGLRGSHFAPHRGPFCFGYSCRPKYRRPQLTRELFSFRAHLPISHPRTH